MPETTTIVTYAAAALILCAVLLIPFFVFRRRIQAGASMIDAKVIEKGRRKLTVPLVLLIVFFSASIPARLFAIESWLPVSSGQLASILTIVFVSWILIQLVNLTKYAIVRRFDIGVRDNLRARRVYTQFKVLENIVIFVIVLIAVSLILMSFEGIRRIGISLLASAGVAGIVIGLAAQRVIATMLAGIQIAITQPIRIDDVVIVEDEWGWIEEINLTYVVVRIWDRRRLVLPTTYFIETPFQNWTRTSADILGTVFFYADYTLPVEAVRQELDRILENNDLWDGVVKNVQVTNTTDRTIEVRVLVGAVDSPTAWDLRVQIREKMLEFLQINYPQCLPRARVELQQNDDCGKTSSESQL